MCHQVNVVERQLPQEKRHELEREEDVKKMDVNRTVARQKGEEMNVLV
jgi:hypothetical protein